VNTVTLRKARSQPGGSRYNRLSQFATDRLGELSSRKKPPLKHEVCTSSLQDSRVPSWRANDAKLPHPKRARENRLVLTQQ
jgi:hypothetical protein